jgi:hypothetical protein
MGIITRRTDTLEGTVAVGDQSYPTAYWIQVLQEFHETRTGGELPGVVDLEGYLTLTGENAPTDLSSGDAILTLEDGRRIGIVCPSLHSLDRRFAFQLGNSMDFFSGGSR